jgi:hypothetical protein
VAADQAVSDMKNAAGRKPGGIVLSVQSVSTRLDRQL